MSPRSLTAQSSEKGLDWRPRKELAQEFHYSGNMNDSASMNVWSHGQVMKKLARNGGTVPRDLMH